LISPRLFIRTLVRRLGYDLHSLPVECLTLRDLEFDLPCLVGARDPRVLDVGANVGQSIDLFRRTLKNPRIVSFEPNPTLATGLRQKYAACDVRVEAMALGSAPAQGPVDLDRALAASGSDGSEERTGTYDNPT